MKVKFDMAVMSSSKLVITQSAVTAFSFSEIRGIDIDCRLFAKTTHSTSEASDQQSAERSKTQLLERSKTLEGSLRLLE